MLKRGLQQQGRRTGSRGWGKKNDPGYGWRGLEICIFPFTRRLNNLDSTASGKVKAKQVPETSEWRRGNWGRRMGGRWCHVDALRGKPTTLQLSRFSVRKRFRSFSFYTNSLDYGAETELVVLRSLMSVDQQEAYIPTGPSGSLSTGLAGRDWLIGYRKDQSCFLTCTWSCWWRFGAQGH